MKNELISYSNEYGVKIHKGQTEITVDPNTVNGILNIGNKLISMADSASKKIC